MIALAARNLSKQFDQLTAVDQVSFEVKKGEIFGFLGPNGAGKTTTINMLTGLARPSSGEMEIAGQAVGRNIKRVQHMLGIVPDESNLYDELSGYDNLCFCAALYGMGKKERQARAKELLNQFGLAQAANRKFKAFSKGMKRKLTIAAGIIHYPEILFLDEPTTGIDVASARQIRQLITTLNKKGTTIFLTTHYIEEAERLCHRIAFIVAGKIVRCGPVEQLMSDVQDQQIMELRIERCNPDLPQKLMTLVPDSQAELTGEGVIRLYSPLPLPLAEIFNAVDKSKGELLEARRIRPSLEEVFVQVTGIEKEKMTENNIGGRKKK